MPTLVEKPEFRALVVDDDSLVVRMVSFALQQEGFKCDKAMDGEQALTLLDREPYDLLVTDLQMPNKHGHALAVQILAREVRPKIMVHTSIDEPRVTKDLMVRGVDDVVYKPTNYAAFAAKARGLVVHSRREKEEQTTTAVTGHTVKAEDGAPIGAMDLKAKLSDVSQVIPVSRAALDVSNMVHSKSFDAEQVAAAVQRDPSIAAKMLELANSPFYNSTGKPIADLRQAVTRIGQTRVGELALATSAMAAFAPEALSWIDVDLTWRRNVAAGIAVELLIAKGGHASISEGLLFSALLHSSGRVVLGTHYPQQYEAIVKACADDNEPLLKHEKRVFPESHAEVMVGLLADWNIPAEVYQPLKYILNDYRSLSSLPEPMRTKVELVKLAILIGRIAVGRWECWDLVEFPPDEVSERLGIAAPGTIIKETERQLQGISNISMQSQTKTVEDPMQTRPLSRYLAYCNRSRQHFDFLAKLVPSMGIGLYADDFENGECDKGALVNCIGARSDEPTERNFTECNDVVFVRDAGQVKDQGHIGTSITVPCSYAALRSACWKAAGKL